MLWQKSDLRGMNLCYTYDNVFGRIWQASGQEMYKACKA